MMTEINLKCMSVGDCVEAWLNNLLCLDATVVKPLGIGCPHPDECDL
jgi:N-acetyltransferase 10